MAKVSALRKRESVNARDMREWSMIVNECAVQTRP